MVDGLEVEAARWNGARGDFRLWRCALERRGDRFSSAASPLRLHGGALAPSRGEGPLVHPEGLLVASIAREGRDKGRCSSRRCKAACVPRCS